MSPACHVSTEIHKLLEHEMAAEGTPSSTAPSVAALVPSVAADGFGLMCIHHDQPDGVPPLPERYRVRRSSTWGFGERLKLPHPSLISGRAGYAPIYFVSRRLGEDGAELLDISHAQMRPPRSCRHGNDLSMRPPNPTGYRMSVEVRSSDCPLFRLASGFWMGREIGWSRLSVAAAFSKNDPQDLGNDPAVKPAITASLKLASRAFDSSCHNCRQNAFSSDWKPFASFRKWDNRRQRP
jgi:hypothetical protein